MNEGLLRAAEWALCFIEDEVDRWLDDYCELDDHLRPIFSTLDPWAIDHVALLSNMQASLSSAINEVVFHGGPTRIKPLRPVPADARAHVAKRIRGGADAKFRFKLDGEARLRLIDDAGGEA